MSKTKYKGVFYDEKHNSYYVNTTFKTKDGYSIKKCKRGFSTAKKANDWKLEFTVEAKNSNTINNKGSLERILINYIEYKKAVLKPASIRLYSDTIRLHFIPNMPNNINKITISHFLNLYDYLSKLDQKIPTKNLIIRVFNNFIDWLDLTEHIDSSLAKKFKIIFVKFTDQTPNKASFLTLDEYSKFIKTFDKEKEEMYVLAFNILFFTGARFGEALALEFSDVDFEKSTVQFNKQVTEASAVIIGNEIPTNHKLLNRKLISPYTKTNTIKTVSIPSWLLEDIKIWQQKNHSNFIFASNGGIMSRSCIASRLKKHLELAGLHKIRVHDLRHSHTTLLYESGCDAKYVAERLGHSTEITSLNTYKHLSQRKRDSNDDIIKGLKL